MPHVSSYNKYKEDMDKLRPILRDEGLYIKGKKNTIPMILQRSVLTGTAYFVR